MKKRLLACGLVPALVLGTFGTVGAQPAADAAVQLKQGGAPAVQAETAEEPVTQESLKELRSQLVEVRANGYAIDDEENELGVRCVAVAIPGPDGRAESAFSISGLAPYMTPERIRRIATLALDARTDILADLGLR